MNKKQRFTLLITFIFVCLISINVFAVQQPYVTNGNLTTNISEQQQGISAYQQNQQIENSTIVNEQLETKIEGDEALPSKQKTELFKIKEQSRDALTKSKEKYKNNAVYGTIAYILDIVRLTSLPFFVVGYLISIVYEFIVGMKRREMVRKGRGMRITMVSAFVMAQIMPLIFAIVIKFWGN